MTVALVLILWSVARLLTMWRVLHVGLIAAVPMLLLRARRLGRLEIPAPPQSRTGVPPVPPSPDSSAQPAAAPPPPQAAALLLFLALGASAFSGARRGRCPARHLEHRLDRLRHLHRHGAGQGRAVRRRLPDRDHGHQPDRAAVRRRRRPGVLYRQRRRQAGARRPHGGRAAARARDRHLAAQAHRQARRRRDPPAARLRHSARALQPGERGH